MSHQIIFFIRQLLIPSGSIRVIVTYPRVAIPIAVIIVITAVVGHTITIDKWSKVTKIVEASIVESKIVEVGRTKCADTSPAYTASRESHVTATAAVPASD